MRPWVRVGVQGWMRYVHAGIDVFDRARQEYVDPKALMPDAPDSAWLPEEPEVPDGDLDATVRPDRGPAVGDLILEHARPEVAPFLLRLDRTAKFALAVTQPQQTSGTPRYFRVHDAVVEEPTRAAAYVNFNGTVDLALSLRGSPRRAEGCRVGDAARGGSKALPRALRDLGRAIAGDSRGPTGAGAGADPRRVLRLGVTWSSTSSGSASAVGTTRSKPPVGDA